MTDEKIYDFIIAGSGIAGNVCAFLLAQKNKSCLILEKQPCRTEKICGGGFSHKALKLLAEIGIDVAGMKLLEHKDIFGHVKFFPENITEKIYGGGKVSLGIQRRLFDEFLLQQAIGAGAEIFYGVPVSTVKFVGKIFHVNERYLAKNFVVATGAGGFLKKTPRGQSFGLSVLIKGFSLLASDKFYFWYGDDSGDKYCWLFPVGAELWNAGIWQKIPDAQMSKNFSTWLEKITREYFPKNFAYASKIRGSFLGNVDQRDNGLFSSGLGDFAGRNNILNGGGIIGAIESAIEFAQKI